MIVGKQKPLQEIWQMIKDHKNVLVLGCNTCVAVCHSGGDKEAEILASLLRMLAIQEGKDIDIKHNSIGRQCEDHEDLKKLKADIEEADALVSTACGAGVQYLAEKYPGLDVYPGLDTSFLGTTEQTGVWTERCQACGQCILAKTGGICPVSRCAKRLLNGPCGGSSQGKCEINPDIPCAWQLIIDRFKDLNQYKSLWKLIPIKDWSADRAGGPRKIIKDTSEEEEVESYQDADAAKSN